MRQYFSAGLYARLEAGVFLNLEPVVGTVLADAILHEPLTALTILSGVLIIGAAVYFSLHPLES